MFTYKFQPNLLGYQDFIITIQLHFLFQKLWHVWPFILFPAAPCQAAADSILSGLKRANKKKENSSDKGTKNGKGKAKAKGQEIVFPI